MLDGGQNVGVECWRSCYFLMKYVSNSRDGGFVSKQTQKVVILLFCPSFFYDFHSLKHSVFDAFSLSFALLFICAHHCVANTIQNDSIFFDGTIWFVKIVESIPHCSIVCAMASSLENWWCWNCHQIIYHLAIIASLWMIINELNFW